MTRNLHRRNLLLWLALLTCGCAKTDAGQELQRVAGQHVGQVVDLGAAMTFAWDQVAMFGPYQVKPQICKTLSLSKWDCFWLPEPSVEDSGPSMIVFLRDGAVARTAFMSRCDIRLATSEGGRTTARNATFRVSSVEADERCATRHLRIEER